MRRCGSGGTGSGQCLRLKSESGALRACAQVIGGGTSTVSATPKGTFHGLRKRHVQRYLDEFVFRWNRRRHLHGAFDRLLGIGVDLGPATYRDFVEQRA